MSTQSATPRVEETRERFRRLAQEWKQKSRHLSNTAQMAMLRPYQQIIGMGLRSKAAQGDGNGERQMAETDHCFILQRLRCRPIAAQKTKREGGAAWFR